MSGFSNEKQGIALKCPSCGSDVVYDPVKKLFTCSVCKSEFNEEQLEDKAISFTESKTFDEVLKTYYCPSCGAEVITDENTATEFCAYCGTPVVLSGRVSGEIKPDLIIPFELSKEQAKTCIKEFLDNYSFVPKSFYKEANLNKITGIYYPFWESDIDSDSKLFAEGQIVRTWTTGETEYTETSYYDVKREGDIHFEDISVNALKASDKKLVESILPYPIKNHIPFDMKYLAGFYAKKNDLRFDEVKGEILSKLSEYSKQMLLGTTGNYTNITVNYAKANVVNEKHDYTLLPIWILSYKYRKKNYTFAVNGVTGKVFGEVPLSHARLGLTCAGISGIVFAVLALLGGAIL